MALSPPKILIDGLISWSFSPNVASTYLEFLFKTNLNNLAISLTRSGEFVIQTTEGPVVVDCLAAVGSRGTPVPQRLWKPKLEARADVREAELQHPVFFISSTGTVGVTVDDALSGNFPVLRRRETVAVKGKQSTYIHIGWPCYEDWKSQISLAQPFTVEKFDPKNPRLDKVDPQRGDQMLHEEWKTDGRFFGENLLIIGAINVSAGSWQPIFQLNEHLVNDTVRPSWVKD
ncbi:hypothetical protein OF83DRAFT_1088702 [Amylostereum chailletii]|nr:hypothetical protein OF83DRAFT_1088702 [Amylostereum chailletii]